MHLCEIDSSELMTPSRHKFRAILGGKTCRSIDLAKNCIALILSFLTIAGATKFFTPQFSGREFCNWLLMMMFFLGGAGIERAIFAQNMNSSAKINTASEDAATSEETKSAKLTATESLGDVVVTDFKDFATLGSKAYNDGLYDMAEKMYSKYWEKANDQDVLIDAAVNLSKSKISQNKMEEAMSVLQGVSKRNRELYPSPNSAYHQLSKENYFTINFWIGRLLFMQEDLGAAVSIYEEIIRQSSLVDLKIKALLGLADCYIGLKDWQQAKIVLDQILESTDNETFHSNAYIDLIQVAIGEEKFSRATSLIDSGFDTAEGEFRISLELMQIVSFLAQNKNEDAFNYYRTTFFERSDFLNRNSNYPILRNLGLSLIESQAYDSAKDVFERMLPLLRKEHQKKETLLDLAKVEDSAGQRKPSIRHYLKYIELYKNDERTPKIRLRIAQLFEEEQDYEKALEYFKKIYDAETNLPELKYEAAQKIAWINRNHKKDYEKAIKYFFESSTFAVDEDKKARGVFFAAETYFLY